MIKHGASGLINHCVQAIKEVAPEKVKKAASAWFVNRILKFSTVHPVIFLSLSCIGMFMSYRSCRKQVADNNIVAQATAEKIKAETELLRAQKEVLLRESTFDLFFFRIRVDFK